jgi:DNA polymerase III epsilon subunit-like protein
MYLVFDTETNGFAKADYKDPTMPRVTQLAWKLFNSDGKQFKSFSSIIKPDGWTIPTPAELRAKGNKDPDFFVRNNMSTERCEAEGKPMAWAIKEFVKAIEECKYIIAHNIEFDLKMMASEMYRLKIVTQNKPVRIDTMKHTTDICKIPSPKGGYKWPNLTELHVFCFQKPFDGAHDAMADVDACANCFFDLKRKKLFIIADDAITPVVQNVLDGMSKDEAKVLAEQIKANPEFVSTTHDLPWLNKGTEDYVAQVEMLLKGLTCIDEIKKHFRLSREMEEKLNLIKL